MAGGGSERGSRRRTRAASVVVPFPQSAAGDRLDLARLLPSGRLLLLGVLVLALGLGAYWAARSSSAFAVERVEVSGDAHPSVLTQVRRAVDDLVGTSLVTVDPSEIEAQVRGLPAVAGVSVDRAFPHTLVVRVAGERPIAVARLGRLAWLVTQSGRVVRRIPRATKLSLPRIWVSGRAELAPGGMLPEQAVPAARAVSAARAVGLGRRVKAARLQAGDLTVTLRGGSELRLGVPRDVHLKLAVAARVLPAVEGETAYVDVSVPERPVAVSAYFNP